MDQGRSRYQTDPNQKSAMDQAADLGHQALDQAAETATAARDTVKEHPITTLAVIGGLAFAIGALWKMQQSSKVNRTDALMARLADLQHQLPRRWRA